MDDIEDDARYPPNTYGISHAYGSSQRQKLPARNTSYPEVAADHYIEDDEEEEDEIDGEEEDEENSVQRIAKEDYDEEEDEDDEDYGDLQRHQKKRKLKTLLSSYEFAPRVPASNDVPATTPKPSFGGRNSLTDWTEHETFVLLDAWGDRFIQHGRKSLRSEEWQEVAEKVSQESKIERSDTQCRNRLDTLKKKYKKEKAKLEGSEGEYVSQWGFYKKMDGLLNLKMKGHCGLGCGVDSGEYIFMNPRVYLDKSNVLDEMRDSPAESDEDHEELEDGSSGEQEDDGESAKLLADSIQRFGEIYEKIEDSKRRQIMELEKMRRDFQRELELQKKQIIERAQLEIDNIRERSEENDEEEDEEEEGSTDNDDDDDDDDGGDNCGNEVPPINLRR